MVDRPFQLSCLLFSLLFSVSVTQAQSTDSFPPAAHKKSFFNTVLYKTPGKDSMVDFVDILRFVFAPRYQAKPDTGFHKHTGLSISFVPGILYSLSTGLAASINANATPRSGNEKDNLSNFFTNLNYTQKKQIIFQAVTNIWTKNNDYNINTNWSYLKYPQQDFGLGGYSTLDLVDQFDYSYLRLYQSVLKKVAPDLYIGPGFNLDYHWNITDTTTINKPVYGATQYGLTTRSTTAGLLLTLLYDTRKNIVNPVYGSTLVNIIYRNNETWLGSDQHSQSLLADLRKYVRFPANSKNILAFWNYDWLTLQGHLPYLDLPNTGGDTYGNTGRGYIQGRFRGTQMLYLESEYRFRLTENGLLGGVVFCNAESFSEKSGNQFQTISPGYGAGLRVKFNKHSNTNIAIDYGFGKGGSHGLFMNLGEMF